MKDEITQYRLTCHCGHDITSHFDKAHDCLCTGCACKAYVNEYDPKPAPALPRRPNHASHCRCPRCLPYV